VVLGLRLGNFGVYVYAERGQPHHLPHAHIKQGAQRVGSVYLLTLDTYDCRIRLPRGLLAVIAEAQLDLLQRWQELNPDD
jgi:hypothetical protein